MRVSPSCHVICGFFPVRSNRIMASFIRPHHPVGKFFPRRCEFSPFDSRGRRVSILCRAVSRRTWRPDPVCKFSSASIRVFFRVTRCAGFPFCAEPSARGLRALASHLRTLCPKTISLHREMEGLPLVAHWPTYPAFGWVFPPACILPSLPQTYTRNVCGLLLSTRHNS